MAEGTGLSVVRRHFRDHGYVHAFWTTGVLLAIIAALLLMLPNGSSVGAYISFAASIASLVLAVVAIGQSLIANQSFSETVGSLRSSAANVETAARNIADTSSTLSEQSERMIGEVSRLPSAFEEFSAKVSEQFAQADVPEEKHKKGTVAKPAEPSDPTTLYENAPYGGKAALYILALANLKNSIIEVEKIFASSVVWSNFVAGYMHALRSSSPFGLKIRFTVEGEIYKFHLDDLGEIPSQHIISNFSNIEDAAVVQFRKQIDAYFFSDATPEATTDAT